MPVVIEVVPGGAAPASSYWTVLRCRRGAARGHLGAAGATSPSCAASKSAIMSWLPDDFVHPVHVPVPGTELHLRPIREADTALDHPAVMGSRERLWEIFGPAWPGPGRR